MRKIYNITLHALRAYCAVTLVLSIGIYILHQHPIYPIGNVLFVFGLFLKTDDKVSYDNGLALLLMIFIPSLLLAVIKAFSTHSFSITDTIFTYVTILISGAALTIFIRAKRSGVFKDDHDRAVEELEHKYGSQF